MAFTQRDRDLRFHCPLGEDALLLERIQGREELSRPFEYDLQLVSERGDIDFASLLGQSVTAELRSERRERFIDGHVVRFQQLGYAGGFHRYLAVLRPWLSLLRQTSNCRVFQGLSVPQIFQQIFSEQGFSDVSESLTESYAPRTYCVQYRESTFDFVSRLMEEEGIYYFFRHEQGRHELVLADAPSVHATVEGQGRIAFRPEESDEKRREEYVTEWMTSGVLVPGRYSLRDFDFEKPATRLEGSADEPRETAFAEMECFDYPGSFRSADDGGRYARIRLEEAQWAHRLASGTTSALGLTVGARFSLTDHPRSDQNAEYVVHATTIAAEAPFDFDGSPRFRFRCGFDCLPAQVPFRPARVTPKSSVSGPQTAIVTGPSGEEIHTDEHGRVKVRFHWDRLGAADDTSSCWLRVAQSWAGHGWGSLHLPRVGQEVIVSFLEGDPDRPIVTGRVYNGLARPPVTLPGEKTVSGFRSRSSREGASTNANELVFDDRKGEELLRVQAERNLEGLVKADSALEVGNDATVKIGNDLDQEIGSAQTVRVGTKLLIDAGDEIEIVTGSASITMKSNGDISISGKKISVNGMEIGLEADTNVKIEGGMGVKAKAGVNASLEGVMVDVKASGIATIKGSLAKIN